MGLSSNILWHQTDYNSLCKILRSKKFLCSYSVEDVKDIVGKELAFPMISMCDLPISEFSEYQNKYGGYSIGLNHEWGIKHKFTPIWYYEPKSRVPLMIKSEIEHALKSTKSSIVSFGVLSYMKKLEGPLLKHNYSSYRFYDEREVRFVPSFEYVFQGHNKPILTKEEYNQFKRLKGNSIINASVDFDWRDVRYIIVKEDYQISKMITFLSTVGCDNKAIAVFSQKQVIQDFIGYKHNVVIPQRNSIESNNDLTERILTKVLNMLENQT